MANLSVRGPADTDAGRWKATELNSCGDVPCKACSAKGARGLAGAAVGASVPKPNENILVNWFAHSWQ